MKKLIVFSIAVLSIASCKKDNSVAPIKVTPTYVGAWTNNNVDELKPVFAKDTLYWEDNHGVILTGYTETIEFRHDTIVETYSTGANPQLLFKYKVNATNDTLTMSDYGFTPYKADTLIYWRQK